jgi:flagellar biogenesis protein FliO
MTVWIIKILGMLVALMALAVLVLYAAQRVGLGRPSGPLELWGRLPLEGRRAIYLVRAGKTVYVIAVTEASVLKLGELPSDELVESIVPPAPFFAATLERALRRRPSPAVDEDDAA